MKKSNRKYGSFMIFAYVFLYKYWSGPLIFWLFSTSSRKKQREEEDNCSKEWLTLIELVMQKGDVSDMIGLVERILSPSRVCEIRIMIQDFVTHERAVRLKTKYPGICMICNCYRIQPFLKVLISNN